MSPVSMGDFDMWLQLGTGMPACTKAPNCCAKLGADT